jgi:hypothetical protein
LNPFAFYPKHLKNTLIHLMQSEKVGDHLASLSIEESSKFDNAFIDMSLKEKDKKKIMDVKFQKKEDLLTKKRYLASTLLKQSFHVNKIYDVWQRMHDVQKYDRVQEYLSLYLKKFNSNQNNDSVYLETNPEFYYSKLKPLHKLFTKGKD